DAAVELGRDAGQANQSETVFRFGRDRIPEPLEPERRLRARIDLDAVGPGSCEQPRNAGLDGIVRAAGAAPEASILDPAFTGRQVEIAGARGTQQLLRVHAPHDARIPRGSAATCRTPGCGTTLDPEGSQNA